MNTNTQATNGAATQAAVITTNQAAAEPSGPMEFSVPSLKARIAKVEHVLKDVMEDGKDYGQIPGCGDKPALLKSGAELLLQLFDLVPQLEVAMKDLGSGHREVTVTIRLIHAHSGKFWGMGIGSCSTMEAKYRYRNGSRKCPKCGKESIFKSKNNPGWFCWSKKGGCGENFKENDSEIIGQQFGLVENANIADSYNTVLKQAKKRSLVDAALTATAASRYFTQDMDEFEKMLEGIDIDGTDPENVNRGNKSPVNGTNQGSPANSGKSLPPLSARAAKMIEGYEQRAGVSRDQLERFIRKPAELWNSSDCDRIRDVSVRMTKENISFAEATGANTTADPAADAAQLADLQLEASNLCLRFSDKTQAENILSDNGLMDQQAIAECKSVPTLQRAIAALRAALPSDDDQLFGDRQHEAAAATAGKRGAFGS